MPADTLAPSEDLVDVLDATRGDAGQVHLDNGLLDRRLAPFVALDDRRGEAHALELRHLERDLARRRGEAALVVAGAVSGALIGALVGSGADEPVDLLVEHRVDGLLTGSSNDTISLDVACLRA